MGENADCKKQAPRETNCPFTQISHDEALRSTLENGFEQQVLGEAADCKKHEPNDFFLHSETASTSEDNKQHQEKTCHRMEASGCSVSKLDLDHLENDANKSPSKSVHVAAIGRPSCGTFREHAVSAQTA